MIIIFRKGVKVFNIYSQIHLDYRLVYRMAPRNIAYYIYIEMPVTRKTKDPYKNRRKKQTFIRKL